MNYGSEQYAGIVGDLGLYTNLQPSCCYHKGKIYVCVQPQSASNYVRVVNPDTLTVEASYNLSTFLNGQLSTVSTISQFISYGDYIYVIYRDIVLRKDVVNNTTERIASLNNAGTLRYIAAYDNKLYVCGGWLDGYTNFFNTISEVDLQTGTVLVWGQTLPLAIAGGGIMQYGKYLYLVGGSTTTGGSGVKKVYRIDLTTKGISAIDISQGNFFFAYAAVGSKLYMFGGANSWSSWNQNNYNFNTISYFDASTETFVVLNQTLDINLKNACACAVENGIIYIFGGYGTTTNAKQIRKFVASSPLANNHLLLQEDFGVTGLWSALKSKDTDLKVKVINAYLGDSNNIAQLTNAYLYDTASNQWKSLSGESYVADMQNALNILGVT